ncbi:ATP-binding protein [Paenibacillus sp. PL2-23]|uniref:two-component system sensor histidine kinase NtrB n=1 Tax=Paenibacillus sp. PL2-23 TaxID=2100729 RepID=UPI0030FCF2B2
MLKDLLLQFFLSVLPVFAFLLWHDKDRSWEGFRPFIAITSGLAMLLCLLLSTPSVNDYEVDFRIVPFVIGSLYGGYRALAVLSILHVVLRAPTLSSVEEAVSFSLFLAFAVLLLTGFMGRFQRESPEGRERIGVTVISFQIIITISMMTVIMGMNGRPWTLTIVLDLLVAMAGLLLATWLSVYIIEGIKEKQQLHNKVDHLSLSYRNEVEKLQQFIDKAPIAVMIVDRDARITHVNEEGLRLFNLMPSYTSVDSLKNKPYAVVFLEGAGDMCFTILEQALKGRPTGTVPHMEDGKTFLYTAITLREVGSLRVTGAAIIAQDITELSVLRDELGRMERLSLVGQMAASITHEIRNPMAVIRGFVQLIQERSPQNQHEYFRVIMEELDRANMIINDFLSLAQNRDLKMEMGSLNSSIRDLEPLLLADANLRGQSLEVSLCEDLPPMRMNDREIKQMLLNIARNGMEAMEEKGILRIRTTYDNGEISITISDEGVGIPHDIMGSLFEPFFTTKTRGTGLGLPLCLSIAERHGGRIDVQSQEGQGTTFIVSFNILAQ